MNWDFSSTTKDDFNKFQGLRQKSFGIQRFSFYQYP